VVKKIYCQTVESLSKRSGSNMYHLLSTMKNSTFRPHSALMIFVEITEKTPIISLKSINGLVWNG
jgi:hypothetical protein